MNWNPFKREVKNISIGELDEFMLWKMNARLGGTGDIGELRRRVPWLFRGVDLIAQAIHDYPFDVLDDGGEIVASSTDWQDNLPDGLEFTSNIFELLYKVSASLTLRGKSYVYPTRNRLGNVTGEPKELRYWVVDTVTPIITETNGLEKFVRQVGNIKTEYPVTEAAPFPLCYFWLPDPDVELGPPASYPAQAALNAAGVLFSLDDFFKSHVEDGMKKAILFAVKGLPPTGSETGKAAKDKLEDDLSRTLLGKPNSGKIRVVNADTMTPVIYGEGLQEIANTELTKEKREDIATALGIPMTMLWSSEASGLGGGGVTKEDTYRFYKHKVCPDFNFIASIFNQQLLKPLGYRIVGNPETLDVFQEDEAARSQSLDTITSAIDTNPQIAKFTMELLGYDLSDEQTAELDELIAAKSERAAQVAQLSARQPQVLDVTPQPKQLPPGETPEQKRFRDDLMRWQRKVENRLRAGKAAQVEFDSDAIDTDTNAQVYAALAGVSNADAVKVIFAEAELSPELLKLATNMRAGDARQRICQAQAVRDIETDKVELLGESNVIDVGAQPSETGASPFGSQIIREVKATPLPNDKARRDAEIVLRDKITKLLKQREQAIIEQIQRGEQVDLVDFQNEIAIIIENELTANAASELARTAGAVGFEWDPTAYNQAAREWAKRYSYDLVRDLTERTRKVIQDAVEKFTAGQGLTKGDLQDLLTPAFGADRANAISVTETSRSYFQSQVLYKDMLRNEGVTMEMVWHTTKQDVCPLCIVLDGKPESEWGGAEIPRHVNCKCFAGLRVKQ